MTTLTAGMLEVPGAQLYHEVRGAGPALLLITGGSGDPMIYQRVADALADRYTVISYERRGFSRSPLAEPPDDGQRIATDTDDVVRLLDALTDRPAAIFGSSSGAIVGLDVITKHPERVRTLVCHEPPLAHLVADGDQWLDLFDSVYASYRRDGLGAAMQGFNAAVGMDDLPEHPPGTELPAPVLEMLARMKVNSEFWLEHELRQYPRMQPDIAALQAVSYKLVLAGGSESRQYFPYRPNLVLAAQLGLQVVDFPGNHIGYALRAPEFAEQLHTVLAAKDSG